MSQVRRVWGACLLAVVVLAGCKVDTRVTIDVHANGSGTVRTAIVLDKEAVDKLGGVRALPSTVKTGDLANSGWIVSPWTSASDGTAAIVLTRSFRDAGELTSRLRELAGPNGVLRDAQLRTSRGWFGSSQQLSMLVDLHAPSAGIVNDAALAARLRAAGFDPSALDAQLSQALRAALHLTVVVHLPNGTTKTYDAPAGTVTTVSASNHSTDWDRIVKFGIAVTLALLAVLFVIAAAVASRRDRRRRADRGPGRAPEPERAPLM